MTTGDPRAKVNRRAAAIFADIDDYQEQVFLAHRDGGGQQLCDPFGCLYIPVRLDLSVKQCDGIRTRP